MIMSAYTSITGLRAGPESSVDRAVGPDVLPAGFRRAGSGMAGRYTDMLGIEPQAIPPAEGRAGPCTLN